MAARMGLVRNLQMPATLMGAIGGYVATLFALLVAFSVSIVWAYHQEARSVALREASALGNIDQLSRQFPVPRRRQIQVAVEVYAKLVIDDEWEEMAEGRFSERAEAILTELWQTFSQMRHSEGHLAAYRESLARLSDVSRNRQLRLLKSEEGVPRLMWVLLVSVGGVLVLLSFQFEIPRNRDQAWIVALMALLVSFALVLVGALENPYTGVAAILPDAFEHTLEHLQHLDL